MNNNKNPNTSLPLNQQMFNGMFPYNLKYLNNKKAHKGHDIISFHYSQKMIMFYKLHRLEHQLVST